MLRSHPALMRFPVFGALATLLPAAFLVLPGIFLIDSNEIAPGVVLLAVGIYVAVAIGIFFSVALAAAADAIFHGRAEQATSEGYRVAAPVSARSRAGPSSQPGAVRESSRRRSRVSAGWLRSSSA